MPYALAAVIAALGSILPWAFAGSFCLALVPGVVAATIYGSWCYFSSEYDKTKSAEKQKLAQLH